METAPLPSSSSNGGHGDEAVTTIACNHCHQNKPVEDFYRRGDGRLQARICKPCYSDRYYRAHYQPKDASAYVGKVMRCAQCNEQFLLKTRKAAQFCSRRCKEQAWQQQERLARQAALTGRLCEWCQDPLALDKASDARFCSLRCQRQARNDRLRGNRGDSRMAYRFGITGAERDAMLVQQDGCAICHTWNPNGKGWHVDHDHSCCSPKVAKTCGKCLRGILCQNCNLALGHFKDSPALLDAAKSYLLKQGVP